MYLFAGSHRGYIYGYAHCTRFTAFGFVHLRLVCWLWFYHVWFCAVGCWFPLRFGCIFRFGSATCVTRSGRFGYVWLRLINIAVTLFTHVRGYTAFTVRWVVTPAVHTTQFWFTVYIAVLPVTCRLRLRLRTQLDYGYVTTYGYVYGYLPTPAFPARFCHRVTPLPVTVLPVTVRTAGLQFLPVAMGSAVGHAVTHCHCTVYFVRLYGLYVHRTLVLPAVHHTTCVWFATPHVLPFAVTVAPFYATHARYIPFGLRTFYATLATHTHHVTFTV